MAITVNIDLSAKVEQWAKHSAVAMANDELCRVIFISSSIKQRIRGHFEKAHGRKSLNYRVMALLIYLAVRDSLDIIEYIVIDKDYGGAQVQATIKNLLLAHIQRDRPDATAGMIRFAQVRGSRADLLAKQAYDRKIEPDRAPKWGDISKFLGK